MWYALKIKVRYFTTLLELAEAEEEELDMVDRDSLGELIERVCSKYGEKAFNYFNYFCLIIKKQLKIN